MRAWRFLPVTVMAIALPAVSLAADPITYPTSTSAALPVHDEGSFDWTGFYAGVFGAAQSSSANGAQFGGGVALGFNAAFDFFLIGGEVAVVGLTGPAGNTEVQGLARAGILASDDLAVYAAAGYGLDVGGPVQDRILLGGGLELGLSEDVSLRAQYLHGFPITGGNSTDQFTLGANFHF